MEPNILPHEVASKYEALVTPGAYRLPMPMNTEVDLRTITLEDAGQIAKHHPDILKARHEKKKPEIKE